MMNLLDKMLVGWSLADYILCIGHDVTYKDRVVGGDAAEYTVPIFVEIAACHPVPTYTD
jgi:hypothetical protein